MHLATALWGGAEENSLHNPMPTSETGNTQKGMSRCCSERDEETQAGGET